MKKIKPELFFSILILVVGIFLVFVTPIGAGFDEDTHLGRIWEMSKGVIIPNQYLSQGPYYPYAFYQLSYRQDVNLTPLSWQDWLSQQSVKIDWDNMINHKTRAIYFPTLYIVQAFIVGVLGRLLDTPVALMYYAVRLSYLLTFVLVTYLAIRFIPIGKWLLGVLSILPMSLVQASSISPDAINNGISFLFIAWVFYLNSDANREKFAKKDWFITAFLVLSICTLKLNSIFLLLLLLLIPRAKYGSKKWLTAFVVFTVIAVLLVFVGWNLFTSSELSVISTGETSPSKQILGMLSDPGHYLTALVYNIQTQYQRYYMEWVGVSGYAYWKMPILVYLLTPVLLLITVLAEQAESLLDIKKRLALVLIFAITFVGTITIFYLIYNPPDSILIPGVQGRYFIAAVPLLLLAVFPQKAVLNHVQAWLKWGSVFIALVGALALTLVYHVPCGSSWFSGGLCYLPQYKNWSTAASLPVSINVSNRAQQTFIADCENLSQIRIWGNAKADTAGEKLILHLNEDGTGRTLASTELPVDQLPADGWFYFNFPVVPDSLSKNYVLDIRSSNEVGVGNMSIAYSKTNEYKNGNLSINGQAQEGDLLFQYGCLTGLGELRKNILH